MFHVKRVLLILLLFIGYVTNAQSKSYPINKVEYAVDENLPTTCTTPYILRYTGTSTSAVIVIESPVTGKRKVLSLTSKLPIINFNDSTYVQPFDGTSNRIPVRVTMLYIKQKLNSVGVRVDNGLSIFYVGKNKTNL